jgi:uncharacterized protein
MTIDYSDRARALQQRFDTERIAERTGALAHALLTTGDREVIARADMFFLATVDAEGRPTCSYKGGEPGFLHVLDDSTLAFPNYDGNGMYLSMGNLAPAGEVGLLLVDFERQSRMRIHGTATVDLQDPLAARWPEAQLVVRVKVREVFPNCGRYVHRYKLEERSRFVPKSGERTPVPAWKRAEWAKDALPKDDPANDPSAEVLKK